MCPGETIFFAPYSFPSWARRDAIVKKTLKINHQIKLNLKTKVVVVVVLALLLAGCFGGSGGSPAVGRISVTSDPPGAKIFLDGKDTGQKTPATLSNVSVGTHQITLELEGYKSVTKSVSVKRNATVTVDVTLEPEPPAEEPPEPPADKPSDPSFARVYGFVTASNGGQRLPGATVTAYVHDTSQVVASTQTDESGAYTLYVPAGTYDIVVDKPGRAQAKRQALTVDVAGEAKVDLISRKLTDPTKGAAAPKINVYLEVEGARVPFTPGTVVAQGEYVSGVVEVESDYDIYAIQVWVGHRGQEPDFAAGILQDSLDFFLWDLYDAPGETELVVAAYDWQENFTEVRIPFVYEVGEPSLFLDPVDTVELVAVTYGHDLGLYRARRADVYDLLGIAGDPDLLVLPNGHTIDTSRLDKDVTMFVEISWTPVFDAAGYEIERAFKPDGPWERIAKVGGWYGTSYVDLSPDLEPGVPVYYRVRAVGPNDEKGPWSVPVSVTPLDRFAIYLVSPADDAVDVPLVPTFSWTYEDVGADEYYYDIFVAGVTGEPSGEFGYYSWYYEGLQNVTEVKYNFDGSGVDLQPGRTYQWNVIEGVALAYYPPNSMAVSFPWTGPAAGNGYSGALNGEFLFTTTLGD